MIYDVIVVGAGHAGCEAAMAAANMGSKVLLISMDVNRFAQMSCNPAVGGIAKGQIVREIDAIGGYMGFITDFSTLQFRMLNKSKGPAMWSPRAQCDINLYCSYWRRLLESHQNISFYQDVVSKLIINNYKVEGCICQTGAVFHSKAVIITAGTFLNGKLFIGRNSFKGGRIGELSSYGVTEQLSSLGVLTSRMKTGTPPRIDLSSVNLSKLSVQNGDEKPQKFSYLPFLSSAQAGPQIPCYIAHTNSRVHEILRDGFKDSPLFNGDISGIGPRYCPSIEDKLRVFPDKDSHQLFLEPQTKDFKEYYLQGFSSSLPLETQLAALKQIEGFEDVKIYRPAYAVEYDYFDPTQLSSTLHSKLISNLFFAGQVNGTTGYEEAAGQGLIAGINAHLLVNEKGPFVLRRDQAYLGVLIDDLITKGVDEPYRMFTSRAEFRILLRQDNADERLTHLSHAVGLANDFRYNLTKEKYSNVSRTSEFLLTNELDPSESLNSLLLSLSSSEISSKQKISNLLVRPQVSIESLNDFVPRGTSAKLHDLIISLFDKSLYQKSYSYLNDNYPFLLFPDDSYSVSLIYDDTILESAQINIKYKGYLQREKLQAEKISRLENKKIPDNFDFDKLTGLSIECRQKLKKYKPETLAQASRISGVSPSDISVLLVYFGR